MDKTFFKVWQIYKTYDVRDSDRALFPSNSFVSIYIFCHMKAKLAWPRLFHPTLCSVRVVGFCFSQQTANKTAASPSTLSSSPIIYYTNRFYTQSPAFYSKPLSAVVKPLSMMNASFLSACIFGIVAAQHLLSTIYFILLK